MSAFVWKREPGAAFLKHRETDTRFFGIEATPYYDLWPIFKSPTHWVVGFKLFGRFIRTRVKKSRLRVSGGWAANYVRGR